MHPMKVDLSEKLSKVKIEIFSDLHIGSPKCDYELIKERVKSVKDGENTYAIIIGDVVNNSTKTSCGDVFEEELTPMQQVQQAVSIFAPIQDKILVITSGNHERKSYKNDGIDLLYFLASELKMEDRYDYCSCLLFLRFGRNNMKRKICYSIYCQHGDGSSGRTIGGKANSISRRGAIIDADIIVSGHTHQQLTFREVSFKCDPQNNSYYQHEQVFVSASITLKYEQYAETYAMRPTSTKSPVIILDGKKKNIKVMA